MRHCRHKKKKNGNVVVTGIQWAGISIDRFASACFSLFQFASERLKCTAIFPLLFLLETFLSFFLLLLLLLLPFHLRNNNNNKKKKSK